MAEGALLVTDRPMIGFALARFLDYASCGSPHAAKNFSTLWSTIHGFLLAYFVAAC